MTRGKANDKARALNSTGDGQSGPSYADVRYLCTEMEQEYQVRLQWLIDPSNATERWNGPQMWIRLRAYRAGSHGHGDEWAGAALGGNSGSATMPGAMVAACVAMADQLQMRLEKEILSGT